MAQPVRPSVAQVGALYVYHPMGVADRNVYNSLNWQYERYAFMDFINRITDQRIRRRPVSDVDLVSIWAPMRAKSFRAFKKHYEGTKPDPIAQPLPNAPVVPLPVAPTAPAAPAAPAVGLPAHPLAILPPPPGAALPGLPTIAPESICSSDAELSPRFIVKNRPDTDVQVLLSPTQGDRMTIKTDLKGDSDLTWRFASTLYQLPAPESGDVMPKASVYLFVGLDAEGTIRDRAVAKVVNVTEPEGVQVKADQFNEVKANRSLAPIRCSHLQQWRGVQLREIRLITAMGDVHEGDITKQGALHLYTDFAARGDLQELCKAHYEAKRPVPEHFIWYTLKCVVDGLIAMRDGTCESPRRQSAVTASDPADEGWKSMLHLDLKPANIFLEDGNGELVDFPKPILGDFGTVEILPLPPTYSRENGTEGWLPPERNLYDQAENQAKPYIPRDWHIDERSELYCVGLIALSLTKAHKLPIAQQKSETQDLAKTWLDSLSHAGSQMDGGRGPSNLNDLEPQYSVRLYQTLAKCLMTLPNNRYSLDDLKRIVDSERQRVDRHYGDHLKRNHDEMDDDLKVHVTDQQKDSGVFALGTRFSPPKKRRKVNLDELSDELQTKITDAASDWNDPGNYTKLSKEELIPMMQEFNKLFKDGTNFDDESPEDVAMRYLISNLRKHVSRKMPAYTYWRSNRDFDFLDALAIEHRRTVLKHVLDQVIPVLQGSPSASLDAVRILEHAIEWGIKLIDAAGEPRETQLTEPSVLHLAVRQFVFKTPSGASVDDVEES